MNNDEAKEEYNAYRGEINEIYDKIINGKKIKNKCDWYEIGEKSFFFLIIEKTSSNTICSPQGEMK